MADDEARAVEREYIVPLRVICDMDNGLFALSLDDYCSLPATFVDLIRIVREVREEIRKNQNAEEQGN